MFATSLFFPRPTFADDEQASLPIPCSLLSSHFPQFLIGSVDMHAHPALSIPPFSSSNQQPFFHEAILHPSHPSIHPSQFALFFFLNYYYFFLKLLFSFSFFLIAPHWTRDASRSIIPERFHRRGSARMPSVAAAAASPDETQVDGWDESVAGWLTGGHTLHTPFCPNTFSFSFFLFFFLFSIFQKKTIFFLFLFLFSFFFFFSCTISKRTQSKLRALQFSHFLQNILLPALPLPRVFRKNY